MRRAAALIAASTALLWIIGAVWFTLNRAGLYYPFDTEVYPTSRAGPGVQIVDIEGLRVWLKPAEDGMPTIVHFGGNIGNPGRNAPVLREYNAAGFGIVALHYDAEDPSGDKLIADALTVMRALPQRLGVSPDQMVIHGLSLGSGIATAVAVEIPVAGLILEAPFTRLCDMPATIVPLYPYCLLSPGDELASIDRIGALAMPLMIQHGGSDQFIPVAMAQALYAAAPDPKRLMIYPEGDHNDLRLYGAGEDARAFALEITR